MADISELIRATLNGEPEDGMICYGDRWFNRGWVRQFVQSVHDTIDGLGLPEGSPIGFAPQSRPEFIAALLAMLERRHPIVMIYAYMSADALGAKLRDLGLPAVIAARQQWEPSLLDVAREMGTAAIAISRDAPEVERLAPYDSSLSHLHCSPPDEAGIELLTSGTTGPPKQYPISYERIFSRMVLDSSMKSDMRRPVLLYFPLGNISGVYTLLPVIAADDQMILLDKFQVPEWLDFIRQVQPVSNNLPPAAFRMILDAGVDPSELACLKYVTTGAATLDPTLRREFEKTYDVAILQAYGATEFGGVVTSMLPEHIEAFGRTKSDSVGKPVGANQLRIVDPSTAEELPAGKEGRLEVLSPSMSDDWISTTDLCMIDEDGFLYHRGRLDGAIVRGGFKIIPEQVAEILAKHPAVSGAAVVGLPDKRLGQVPVAAIELRKDAHEPSASELETHLRKSLPSTMLPTDYRIVSEMPRTPSMKIDTAAVRKIFEQH